MQFENIFISDFDKWLMDDSYRLERYYDLIPGMTDEDRKIYRDKFEMLFMRLQRGPNPL